MKKEESKELARESVFNRIKRKLSYAMGYREGQKYVYDVPPKIKSPKNNNINEMNTLASIERKLKRAIKQNEEDGKLSYGISETEAKELLNWTVQNAREQLTDENEDIMESSLMGRCGLGQGITATTLMNMGLCPNILNVNRAISRKSGNHAFVTVEIPIKDGDTVANKLYLIDTTYRQFFLRDETINLGSEYIKDKRFGGKVAPLAGYWTIHLSGGKEFAEELLSYGFIEMTEPNAKLYGDGFFLEGRERKKSTRVPKRKELITDISGKTYIEKMKDKSIQTGIDFDDGTIEELYNVTTPLTQMQEKAAQIAARSEEIEQVQTNEDQIEIEGR